VRDAAMVEEGAPRRQRRLCRAAGRTSTSSSTKRGDPIFPSPSIAAVMTLPAASPTHVIVDAPQHRRAWKIQERRSTAAAIENAESIAEHATAPTTTYAT